MTVIVSLAVYFQNFKIIFVCIIILCTLSLIFRIFGTESYMWQNRKDMPADCVKSLNEICSWQDEKFRVVYMDQKLYAQINRTYLKSNPHLTPEYHSETNQ